MMRSAQSIQKVNTQNFGALQPAALLIKLEDHQDSYQHFPGKQTPKTRWVSPTKRFVVKAVNSVIEKVR